MLKLYYLSNSLYGFTKIFIKGPKPTLSSKSWSIWPPKSKQPGKNYEEPFFYGFFNIPRTLKAFATNSLQKNVLS